MKLSSSSLFIAFVYPFHGHPKKTNLCAFFWEMIFSLVFKFWAAILIWLVCQIVLVVLLIFDYMLGETGMIVWGRLERNFPVWKHSFMLLDATEAHKRRTQVRWFGQRPFVVASIASGLIALIWWGPSIFTTASNITFNLADHTSPTSITLGVILLSCTLFGWTVFGKHQVGDTIRGFCADKKARTCTLIEFT